MKMEITSKQKTADTNSSVPVQGKGLSDSEIAELESRVRSEIRAISNKDLVSLYQSALQGAYYNLNASKEGYIEGLPDWQEYKDKLAHFFTLSRNKNKYDFLKKQLHANPDKKQKVGKLKLRRCASIRDLFEECCRTLEILKEIADRNLVFH